MSMSQDGRLLALGTVDGSIILWSVLDWAVLRIFPEVHDLPVTCIAARPYDIALPEEHFTGVPIHAKSASADGQMACLTLQRKVPRQLASRGIGMLGWTHRLILTSVMLWLLSPLAREAVEQCGHRPWDAGWPLCVARKVILAPSTRPGVASIPM
jgi:hypothetical protein